MGLHMVALAKLHFQLSSHGLRPAVGGFVWPLLMKLLIGLRLFRDEAVYGSRLFIFRFAQIAFNRGNGARLERALRLIWGTITTSTATRLSQEEDSEIGQETFHTLSTLSL